MEAVASKKLPVEVCTYIVWGFKGVAVYFISGEGVLVVVYSETSSGVIVVVTCNITRIGLLALMWWNGAGTARNGSGELTIHSIMALRKVAPQISASSAVAVHTI